MITLTNAFSINMLPKRHNKVEMVPITVNKVKEYLATADDWVSAIGHADTAALVGNLLGIEVPCNRTTVKFALGEWGESAKMIVAQYSGPRLSEGSSVLPEGATIEFWWVWME